MDNDGGEIEFRPERSKPDGILFRDCLYRPASGVVREDLQRSTAERMRPFQAQMQTACNGGMDAESAHTDYDCTFFILLTRRLDDS